MSIEERNKALEFTFIDDKKSKANVSERNFNITYNKDDFWPIMIQHEKQNIHCPVELFVEVTEFLTKKGIIKIKNIRGTGPIPLPIIEKKAGVDTDQNTQISNVDALASFDITPIQEQTKEINQEIASQPVGPIISQTTDEIVVDRSVIRTRVNNGDPLSAEKEAAVIREASGKIDKNKKVKRAQEE